MLMINANGVLVMPTLSGKEIPVTGVIFMENIYALKCVHMAITGRKQNNEEVLDDVLKFALK
jgi:hypothetical protein